jgi:hypothetical protein
VNFECRIWMDSNKFEFQIIVLNFSKIGIFDIDPKI